MTAGGGVALALECGTPIPAFSKTSTSSTARTARPSPSATTVTAQSGAGEGLLPLTWSPKWKNRRTLPLIEEKVLELRCNGISRYEICAMLQPVLKPHTPAPSTIYAIAKHHGLNRVTKQMQHSSSPSEKHGWRVLGGMMGPVQ